MLLSDAVSHSRVIDCEKCQCALLFWLPLARIQINTAYGHDSTNSFDDRLLSIDRPVRPDGICDCHAQKLGAVVWGICSPCLQLLHGQFLISLNLTVRAYVKSNGIWTCVSCGLLRIRFWV